MVFNVELLLLLIVYNCCCLSCCFTLILHLFHIGFHTNFDGFLYGNHMVKTSSLVLVKPGYDCSLVNAQFLFSGAFKFKQINTSKPGICLHQIGRDC